MVFEPTFEEISQDADALPDLAGDLPDPEGGQLVAGEVAAPDGDASVADGEQDDAVDAELDASITAGDVNAADLPAYGED